MSLAIPSDLSEVDAAWLSAALGAEVLSVRQGGETGGIAVTSRVARLRLDVRPPEAAPHCVVVKLANPQWTYGSELYEREVQFYREFAPGNQLPIPACFYADYDGATGAFVLVLEDVGDVQPGHRLDGMTAAEADAVIDSVADLHRTWWKRPELGTLKLRGHSPEKVAETIAALQIRWKALEECGKYAIDDALRAALPGLMEAYGPGMISISSVPQTLIHSDLHVENFLLERTSDGLRFIAIDWQNACNGHCAFDVSSVLTSLQPQLVDGEYERLLSRYHDRLAAPGYALSKFRTDVAASIRHQFIGSANWFATVEAQTLRDANTIQGHWARLCAAVIAIERPGRAS